MDKSILEVVHETARGLNKAGVMDIKALKEFDALCSPLLSKYNPEQIKTTKLNRN